MALFKKKKISYGKILLIKARTSSVEEMGQDTLWAEFKLSVLAQNTPVAENC